METARKTLSDQEEKIREFKGQHVGEMPAQVGSNLQILAGLQSQLQTEEDALNTAKQQRVYLETLVNQYRSLQGTPKTSGGAATVGLPAIDQNWISSGRNWPISVRTTPTVIPMFAS